MIYPIILVVAMIGVSLVMMIFVIPKLTELYDQFDAELPITTRFLITVSGFLRSFWHFIKTYSRPSECTNPKPQKKPCNAIIVACWKLSG